MNRLTIQQRAKVLAVLCEGMGINAACRVTDASKMTVLKLLADVGEACAKYHHEHVKNLKTKRVQCDEIWSFCYAKQKNVAKAKAAPEGAGDVWTWTALDSDSKLMISWFLGSRDAECANMLMQDVASRLANRVQLTTDGYKAYLEAVEGAFGADIDYAQLVKIYGNAPADGTNGKYSPTECTGSIKKCITGMPSEKDVSTSHVERSNLTIRMQNRRFTRLTNAFSKKIENHEHAFALFVFHYNFCRIHKTLRVTPAMEAGLTNRVWELEDIIGLLSEQEKPKKRGSYKKTISN